MKTINVNISKEVAKGNLDNLIKTNAEFRTWMIEVILVSGYEDNIVRAVYEGVPHSKWDIGTKLIHKAYNKDAVEVTLVSFNNTERWFMYTVEPITGDDNIRCAEYELSVIE